MSRTSTSVSRPPQAPQSRLLASGAGWSLYDVICHAGTMDRPFEERHDRVSISAVIAGSFNYRTEAGNAVLYPGALMLGNFCACYQCGHEHGVGDRCVSLQLEPDLFAVIAASAARSSHFRFGAALLPAMSRTLPIIADMAANLERAEPMQGEIAVADILETVIELEGGYTAEPSTPSGRDNRRIAAALRYVEDHADEPVALDELAAMAAMSKYHFLRIFRVVTGMTPYQFLLNCRMRQAATRLGTSLDPIAHIAYASGFGDLSTFNRRFRETFGLSPKAFRARDRRYRPFEE